MIIIFFTWILTSMFLILSFSKEYRGYINYIKEIIKMGSSLNSYSTKQYIEMKQIPSGDLKQLFLCVHVFLYVPPCVCMFTCVCMYIENN